MDTKALRQKILDLAIRGKLVPQDPNDEPASVLLERIRAEKERLIAEGKIKRPKKSKASSSESHYQKFTPPFPIPDSWQWVRLGDIAEVKGGTTIPLEQERDRGTLPYIKVSDLNTPANSVEITVSNRYVDEWKGCQVIKAHSILFPKRGGAIFTDKKRFTRNELLADLNIMSVHPLFCFDFVFLWFNSFSLSKIQSGSNIPQINNQDLEPLMLPLPPIEEQRRICHKANLLLGIVNQIKDNKHAIQNIVSNSKSKILELAMQGKLVPQDPTDEPAADMLRRVNPKAQIITDNPHSRNLPNSWCEVRIIDLFHKMGREIPSGQKFKYIDIDSIDNKTNIAHPKEIEVVKAPSRASRHTKKEDIVFSMVRPYLRNIAKVPFEGCIASTGFYVFSPTCAINKEFAFQLLLSPMVVNGLNTFMKGDNSPSINKDNVENYVVPLPPLNEQLRICERLGDLYQLLDEIETSLQS